MRRVVFVALAFVLSCADSEENPAAEPRTLDSTKTCGVLLSGDSSSEVVVRGEFNNWQDQVVEANDGKWTLRLPEVEAGVYAYEVEADGLVNAIDPAVYTKWVSGQEYQALRVHDCQKPSWNVRSVDREGDDMVVTFNFVKSASNADLGNVSVIVAGEPVEPTIDENEVVVRIPKTTTGKTTVVISGSDADGVAAENDQMWLPLWPNDDFDWTESMMYLVFTDRFRDADPAAPVTDGNVPQIASYYGGDFDGVTAAIEEGYFESMGVDVLWLSPVYENPDVGLPGRESELYMGYHGYWPIDPLTTEANYGSDAALQRLIDTAHENGIRVLFDIVLNHVHEQHTYCSENPAWCETTCTCGDPGCAWEEKPIECQFAPYLPDLNYKNHELVERVVADVLALMEKFDVDGLRIDAAKHMDHVIMRTLRLRLEELEAQGAAPFYLVGETFTGDRGEIMRYVADHELHGQFDFPLFYAVRGVFAYNGSFRDLENSASDSERTYGQFNPWMSPFLGNHDVARMATEIAGNKLGKFENTPDLMADGVDEVTQWNIINRMSMAFAFVITQPGVPLIYYGDEVGLAGGDDPDNRRFMPQELNANRRTLLGRVQQLGQARREIAALRGPTRAELWVDDNMYVYARQNGDDIAIVAMNKGEDGRAENVTIPNAYGLANATFQAYGRDKTVQVIDGTARITLDPWEYVILTPQ